MSEKILEITRWAFRIQTPFINIVVIVFAGLLINIIITDWVPRETIVLFAFAFLFISVLLSILLTVNEVAIDRYKKSKSTNTSIKAQRDNFIKENGRFKCYFILLFSCLISVPLSSYCLYEDYRINKLKQKDATRFELEFKQDLRTTLKALVTNKKTEENTLVRNNEFKNKISIQLHEIQQKITQNNQHPTKTLNLKTDKLKP